MNLLHLFKRKQAIDTVDSAKRRIARSQEAVYKAVLDINHPINGLAVAHYMVTDSASVTNRLAELTKKGRLKVAYRKRGLDGIYRNFYVVNHDH